MKSKILFTVLFLSFFATVNADELNSVYSKNSGNKTPVNYMMGTVTVSTSTNIIMSLATNTATTCVPLLTAVHKKGDSGEEVAKLQKFLNEKNGADLNEKGFFGPVTEQEVKNLQYTYGVEVTGIQNEKTTEVINKLGCGLLVKKDRKVFNLASGISSKDQSITNFRISEDIKIYPNAPQKDFQVSKVKSPTAKTVVTSEATTTSVLGNLKSDFDKIKENYKAYLLVFALVLALFWFLRKAATE